MLDLFSKSKVDERVLNSFCTPITATSYDTYESFTHYTGTIESKSSIYCRVTNTDIYNWQEVFYKRLNDYIPLDVKCYIAGGSALTYVLYGNELLIRDYDIFIPDQSTFDKIDKHIQSLKPHWETQNENTKHYSFGHVEIDLIKKPFATIDLLFENFDIDLCCVGFEVNNHNFIFKKKPTFSQIFLRIFKIQNVNRFDFKKEGIKLLKRLLKYTGKGFRVEYHTLLQFYTNSLVAYSKLEDSETTTLGNTIYATLESEVKKDYKFKGEGPESIDLSTDEIFDKPVEVKSSTPSYTYVTLS